MDTKCIVPKAGATVASGEELNLYFNNLGGYAPPDFEEYHKKLIFVAQTIDEAISMAKKDPFYQNGQKSYDSVRSHVDDKISLDDIICIQDQFPEHRIVIKKSSELTANKLEIIAGYLPLSKL